MMNGLDSTRIVLGGVLGLALGAASGSGCSVQSIFTCTTDEQCIEEVGPTGRCEPSNRCTLEDLECPSGRRYHDRAPTFGGQCWEPEMAGTGAGTAMGSSGGGVDGGPTTSGPGTTTSPVTNGDSTTMMVGDGSTSSSGGSGTAAGTCTAQFGAHSGYMLCDETVDQCTFNADLNMMDTCNGVCTTYGGTCVSVMLNDVDPCVGTGVVTCDDMTSNNAICTCSKM